MSCIFVVVPAVVVGWPVLCGAIAGAAGVLGFKALQAGKEQAQIDAESLENWVEIPVSGSEIIADAMARESQFTIRKDDIMATFSRAADGRCMVHVKGASKTDQELQAIGKELVGRVTQQYAYNKVVSELKNQGFAVTHEEVASDQSIRIQVSKFV